MGRTGRALVLEGVGVDGRGSRRVRKFRRKRHIPFGVGVAAIVCGVIFAVALAAGTVMRFAEPYEHQAEQQSNIAQLQAQLNADLAKNTLLSQQIAVLNSQEGIETAARSQRFVEPGEIPLNVQAITAPALPQPVDQSFVARVARAWSNITGH